MENNQLKKYLEFSKLLEKTISYDDMEKSKKYHKSGDINMLNKMLKLNIKDIKDIIKNIDINNIYFSKHIYNNHTEYETSYNDGILAAKILMATDNIEKLNNLGYDSEELLDYNLKPTFSLENENFNKCDLIDGIPKIYRNNGLGKKIIKKLILDYDYISFQEPESSDEMKSLQYSLATNDKGIYSFLKNEQLIMFNKDLEFSYIENILINYFGDLNKDVIKIDSDFKKLYSKELKDSKLNKYI